MNFLFLMLISYGVAGDAELREKVGPGFINWSTLSLGVTGTGNADLSAVDVGEARLAAERSATAAALTRAVSLFASMRMTGFYTTQKLPGLQPLERLFRPQQQRVIETRYFADGKVDVVMELPFTHMMSRLFPAMRGSELTVDSSDVTGVVIDARGLQLVPAMLPRFFNAKGVLMFDPDKLRISSSALHGAAAYWRSMDAALRDSRVEGQPVILKAIGLKERGSSDFLFSDVDAKRITELGSVFADGRVVIVTDVDL